ncbi:MAG: hypothetical protein WB495_22280, partial [Xanthobacteraceae bacterium]
MDLVTLADVGTLIGHLPKVFQPKRLHDAEAAAGTEAAEAASISAAVAWDAVSNRRSSKRRDRCLELSGHVAAQIDIIGMQRHHRGSRLEVEL